MLQVLPEQPSQLASANAASPDGFDGLGAGCADYGKPEAYCGSGAGASIGRDLTQ
jgi:hypothetical protein